ncbi:extensin family protein [Sorangium sp. So ce1014]|uniref:extensin family protein n=1 Tax=Sorangium sp. So ce1014 TaxID=3133326 RepID=UPI003F633FA0
MNGRADTKRSRTKERRSAWANASSRCLTEGTYSCRQMARFQSLVSEHSYANAIDIRSFKLENGRTLSVLRDLSKIDTAASKFLHAVAQRLYDEKVFSVVLT